MAAQPDSSAVAQDAPTPLEFLRALRQAHRAVEAWIIEGLHAAGFTELRSSHLTVLRHLGPEGRRTTDLACEAEITRQGISQLVGELTDLGIVECAPDPDDGRARLVRYTSRGREGLAAATAIFENLRDELAQRLGAERVDALMGELEAVRAAADGEPALN